MSRAGRTIGVLLGTLLLVVTGLLYPALARGEAWASAVWTVPVLAWLPRELRAPILGGSAVVLAVRGCILHGHLDRTHHRTHHLRSPAQTLTIIAAPLTRSPLRPGSSTWPPPPRFRSSPKG